MKFIKNNLRVVIAVGIAIVLIVTGVILLNNNNDSKTNGDDVIDNTKLKEDNIINTTGMSSDDAIKLVKENFGSDNYKFSAEVTDDGLYKVTVINVVDDSKIIYYVDPTTGSAYIDMDIE